MHYVKRGPEPINLPSIRTLYTPGWIRYKNGLSGQPSDHQWSAYRSDLKRVFGGFCAYCEELTEGEVDHFRPKSRFPELAYRWSNWLFSCKSCNGYKLNKWPEAGYVDPCARLRRERPETYFYFDTSTGYLLPILGPDQNRYQRAKGMIQDLKLNSFSHVKRRRDFAYFIHLAVSNAASHNAIIKEIWDSLNTKHIEIGSFIKAWLVDRGYQ